MSTPSSPPPPPATPAFCPLCGTPFSLPAVGACAGCGADLTDAVAERLIELDRRWRELAAEREQLAGRLAATRPAPPPAAPVWEAGGAPVARPPRRRLGVPTVLALGGVALLTAAAAVFTAVTWTAIPPLGQAAILLAATIVAALAALALERRQVPTAAGALGVLTMSFAAVDVVGLDRAGLVELAAFAVPLAAAVAAAVGLALSRADLRWVSTAGAAALVVAAAAVTFAVVDSFAVLPSVLALVGTASALPVAASIKVWPTEPARWTAGIGATAWLTVSGLIGAVGLADGEVGLAAGLAVVVLPIVLLIGAARWTPATLAPATLLGIAGVVAAAAHLDAADLQLAAVAAAALVAAAWSAVLLDRRRRWPVALGCVPAAAAVTGVSLWIAWDAAARLAATIGGIGWDAVDPWGAATVLLGGIALVAVPGVRAVAGWVALPVVLVASGALPISFAWPLVLALAGVAAAMPLALRTDPVASMTAATGAVGWAAGTSWTLAIAAAGTAALAASLATRTEAVRSRLATALTLAAGGLAIGAATSAAGLDTDIALGTGLVAVFLATIAATKLGRDEPPIAGPIVAGLATVVLPTAASTLRAAGLLLLIAATGWLVLAISGWRPARWAAAVVASAGSWTLLADAGIDVVEAYTALPMVALAVAGVWWLVEDRTVRTAVALAPALSVGLVPSLIVLSSDPQVLGRTLGLTVAAGVLALVGVRGRWLAPTAAGAATAVWVAVTQLTIVVQVAPRWVTFAVVGGGLVWLAATYERQQARARSLAQHLGAFR